MADARSLVALIAGMPTSSRLFNHYSHAVPGVDLPDAPSIRRENLQKYLDAHKRIGSKELWVLEAPSKRGALRTGVPLTSENKLDDMSSRLGIAPPFSRATNASADFSAVSQTSQIVWEAIASGPLPILWNALMLRPHKGHLMDTRNPGRRELRQHAPVLLEVVEFLKPDSIVWIGKKSERIAIYASLDGKPVRHPANGGKTEFLLGISEIRTTRKSN